MGFVGYLLFSLKCFDLFAWPLFSLGYPLCASIRAIESNSNSDTRKLVAYWVLYSLILLFEHAFMKLLEWLPFWPTMKLIIMYRLMIPHFSSALYFYELLVQPCLSLEPQFVINLFNEWKEPYLKRDDFPPEAERYQKQNESEASKELLSSESKFIEHNIEPEEIRAVEVTEKNEVTAIDRSKFIEHNIEPEEIGAVEVTEKNEVTAIDRSKFTEHNIEPEEIKAVEVTEKNEVTAIDRDTPIESTLVQTKKSTVIVTDMKERDTTKSIPDFMEVQKEWTCAICQVTTQSETTLNSHLRGKRHRATCEELKLITRAKNKGFPTSTPKKHEHPKQTQKKCASSNGLKEEVNIKQRGLHGLQKNSKKVVQNTHSPLWCYICNLRCGSKVDLESHHKGKKHLARIQELAGLVGGQHA
ncbi:hypothetical protein ACB098_07G074100 [Castanea mollissima]|uniref:HVA22-like protein n=1 Tax=Castanea mollissima TaxID=60419 RepID=A0A8J4VK35_9ROSI|nr:hypothetical protein CMV_011966 [Castanea mollissima]